MQTPEEVWSEIEDGFDSVTQWGISDDQRARVAALIREHDAKVAARAWSEGFATGTSRAIRRMSGETLSPLSAPNPYVRESGERDD